MKGHYEESENTILRWGEIFINHLSDKGLISGIWALRRSLEGALRTQQQKDKESNSKMSKELE